MFESPGMPAVGSSPRARGALPEALPVCGPGGIIPASAGSTPPVRSGPRSLWDHPRERGEHDSSICFSRSAIGSSPRARGALVDVGDGRLPAGIIPASAGSTSDTHTVFPPVTDHPRERGEHPAHRQGVRARRGSSPRARGARGDRSHSQLRAGIIPASAGSTLRWGGQRHRCADHPRERGEHILALTDAIEALGSSPRARGAQRRSDPHQPRPGIIPASAGSTWVPRPTCGR